MWGQEAFGLPVHDNWWQTETGGIMIANLAGADIRPGSMGRPLPGVEVAVLARGDDGRAAVRDGAVEVIDEPGVDGELALRPGWPSMFRGYLHDDERYASSASPAAGTSPATSPGATPTAGCGSSAAPTT